MHESELAFFCNELYIMSSEMKKKLEKKNFFPFRLSKKKETLKACTSLIFNYDIHSQQTSELNKLKYKNI